MAIVRGTDGLVIAARIYAHGELVQTLNRDPAWSKFEWVSACADARQQAREQIAKMTGVWSTR